MLDGEMIRQTCPYNSCPFREEHDLLFEIYAIKIGEDIPQTSQVRQFALSSHPNNI